MGVKKDPTGYITFVLGTQMIMSWVAFGGFLKGDCILYFGLLCLAVFPLYFKSGMDYMAMGEIMYASLYICLEHCSEAQWDYAMLHSFLMVFFNGDWNTISLERWF